MTQWDYDKNKTPTEIGLLPSRGLVYPKGHPFHNRTYVPIRGMIVADEEILLNVAFLKMGTTTIELLKSCISLPDVDKITGDNLLAGDVASLLYSIRINSYGSIYDPTIKCPDCDAENQINVHLGSFPVNTLDLEPIVPYHNIFHYEMKKKANKSLSSRRLINEKKEAEEENSSVDIEFGFLTYNQAETLTKMLRDSEALVEEFSPMTDSEEEESIFLRTVKGNNYITSLLEYMIRSVNGSKDRSKIRKYVRSLRIGESMQFRNFVKNNEPTIRASFDFKCKECDYECNIPMPLNHELFGIRPEHKVEVLLEPHFILTYYSGFTFDEYRRYPVAYKKHFIERMNEEIAKAHKAQSDIPTKAPHHNGEEVRAMLGKTKTHTSNAKMQRF